MTAEPEPSPKTAGGGPLRFADAPVTWLVAAVALGLAFVGLLWVPSYAHLTPTLGGIPFFYWYSAAWLLANAILQLLAYRLIVVRGRNRKDPVR